MAVDIEAARQFILSLPNVEEYDHFGRPAFKANKKTFATLWPPQNRIMVILTPTDQSVFSAFNSTMFFPVPNKWGLKGCTFADLDKVRTDMLHDAITLAYQLATSKTKKKKP